MRQYKKAISSIFLAILLVFTPALSVPAAEEDSLIGVNIVENGGFEELNDEGVPAGEWYPYDSWEAGYAALETGTVFEGKNSMRVTLGPNDPTAPWYRYQTKNFQPGALYEVSAMVNYNIEAGGRFILLVEYYSGGKADAASAYLGGDSAAIVTGNTNNRWVEMKGTFQIPDKTELLVIYCYMQREAGVVYVDNVQCKMSGGPEPYFFSTDEVFYYEGETEGHSEIRIDPFYKPGDEPYANTADFVLLDGEKELASAKNVKFAENGKAEFSFDLGLLKEQEKMYNVNGVVKDATGAVIREYTSEVYIYPWPTALREDGVYIGNDGKPFHPSIAYWPLEDYGKMKEVGINVAEISAPNVESTREKLDRLHAEGMMGLVSLFAGPAWMQPAGHPQNIATTKEIVSALKDHPAVFAWCLMDEPLGAGLEPDRIRDMITSYKIVREIDKHRPCYVLDFNTDLYAESQKYGDLWTVDIYTYGDTSGVTIRGKRAMEVVAGRPYAKPTYFIGQTYESGAYGLPTIDDVRGCLYRAFEFGAKGIGYYTLATAIGQVGGKAKVDLPDTALWEPMTKFAANEQQMLFEYFVEKKYPVFNLCEEDDEHSFYYTSWVVDGDLWIIAHNRGNETIQAEVPLVSDNGLVRVDGGEAVAIGGTEENLSVSGGTLKVEMAPQKVFLYKLSPNSEINTETLSIKVEKPTGTHSGTFSDLAGYDWASTAIEELYAAGIINETTVYSYSPGANITRGDFAMYLMRALGLSADGEGFADVAADAPYAREVTTGRALEILEGIGENLFSPEAEISRQDMMKITARGMRYVRKLAEGGNTAVLDGFSDSASVADYAREDAAAMIEAGIIHGNADGTINPLGKTTRAEAAVIMDRIIKTNVLPAPETPENPEGPGEDAAPQIVFAKETVSEEQAEKRAAAMDALKKLGIAAFEDGTAPVTRAEAAELLIRAMGVTDGLAPTAVPFTDVAADHPASGYIEAAYRLGIMNGTGGDIFSPDGHVTYVQLVKMLVDALGYSAHAQALGGWSAGYMTQAAQLELTKNLAVQEDGALTAAAAALLVRNALDIPIAQRASFGTDELKFVQADGVTMLTAYHGLTRSTGKITATDSAVIEAPRMLRAGEVAMGQAVLEAGESGAEACLGQQVTVYTREGENGMPVILLCEGKRNTEIVTVQSKYLIPEKSGSAALYWHDEDYNEYSESFANGAVLLYNGKAKPNFTGADFDITDGSVTLLMDGSGISTAIVEEYTNHVLDSVSTTYNTLYFTDGTSLVVDKNDTAKKVMLYDTKGKELEVSDLKANSVVSAAISEDGSILNLVVSTQNVKGTVTESSTDSVIINDTEYDLAYNLRIPQSGVEVPALGLEAAFVLDKSGKLAYVDTTASVVRYGYFSDIEKKKGLDGTVTIRLFTEEGVMEYPTLAKTVRFNGENKTPAEVYEAPGLRTVAGIVKSQLVVYEKNEAGEISVLKTVHNAPMMSEEERQAEFTMDFSSEGKADTSKRFVAYDQKSIGDLYRYDGGTVMFLVPDVRMEDKFYSVFDLDTITDGKNFYDTEMTLYDIDENMVAGAVVCIQASSTAEPVWGGSSKYLAVTGTRELLSEDGEVILGVSGWSGGSGAETVVPIKSDQEIIIGNSCFTTGSRDNILPADLRPGDILYYQTSDLDGTIMAARLLLRADTPEVKETSQEWVSEFYNFSQCTRIYAPILDILDTGLLLQAQYKRLYVWKNQRNDVPIILCERTTDANGNVVSEFKKISQADILKTDHAFVGTTSLYNQIFVIYRNK